jgi:hypothetical protein
MHQNQTKKGFEKSILFKTLTCACTSCHLPRQGTQAVPCVTRTKQKSRSKSSHPERILHRQCNKAALLCKLFGCSRESVKKDIQVEEAPQNCNEIKKM